MKFDFRYLWLAMVLSALIPITSIDVFASVNAPTLFIASEGSNPQQKTMELKATNEGGQTISVSDFEITVDNIISIQEGGKVRVFAANNGIEFTKARTLDQANNAIEIPISNIGEVSFAGYKQGVYVQDVVVDDRYAYEAIVVIGEEADKDDVDNEVKKVNNKSYREITKVTVFKDKDKDKDKGNPYCDLVPDDYKGSCHDRKDYSETTGLYPCRDGSNVKDWRDCKDAGKHPDEQPQLQLKPKEPVPVEEENDCYVNGYYVCNDGEFPTCNEDSTNTPCFDEEETRQEAASGPPAEELTANCGGVPCTPTEKEDSWTDLDEDVDVGVDEDVDEGADTTDEDVDVDVEEEETEEEDVEEEEEDVEEEESSEESESEEESGGDEESSE